jgi:hypothetical protein
MPLLDTTTVETVKIDGDEYSIRAWVSLSVHNASLIHIMTISQASLAVNSIREALANGHATQLDIDTIGANLERSTEARTALLKAWLVDWSHDVDLNDAALERVPQHHVNAILSAINARIAAHRGDVANDPK